MDVLSICFHLTELSQYTESKFSALVVLQKSANMLSDIFLPLSKTDSRDKSTSLLNDVERISSDLCRLSERFQERTQHHDMESSLCFLSAEICRAVQELEIRDGVEMTAHRNRYIIKSNTGIKLS